MKYFYYGLGLLLALAPNILFAVTLKHWPTPWEDCTSFARALLTLGVNSAGANDVAVEQFREALKLHPGDLQHVNLAVALAQTGNLGEAYGELREALSLNPQNTDAHTFLGTILVMQGRPQEGIAEFEETLRIDRYNSATRWRLGSTLIQLGQKKEGLAQFQQVIHDAPRDPESYFNLGNVLMQMGQAGEAAKQYEKALEFAPDNATLLKSLAQARTSMPKDAAK